MTIGEQITRIRTNVANAYEAIQAKGGDLPSVLNSDYLADTISSIEGGSTSGNKEGISFSQFYAGEAVTDILEGFSGTITGSISITEYVWEEG